MSRRSTTTAARAARPARTRPARARLLAAASRLFYADGLASTGIDAITAEAGVAKMSLYNNFESKADLVGAYLDDRHHQWLGLYAARLRTAHDPVDRVLCVFDAYIDHANGAYENGFRGCGLLNAAAELPVGDPGRDIVRRHKDQVESLLRDPLRELMPDRPTDADELAEHLMFVLEGATARAGLEGSDERLRRARSIARTVVTTQ